MAKKYKISIEPYKKKASFSVDTSGIHSGTAVGYIVQKAAMGLAGVFEGIGTLWDVTAAKLQGDDDYAAYRAGISAVGDWRKSVEKRYNPGEVLSFAGAIGEAVGQSSTFFLNAAVPFLGTGVFFAGVTGNSVAQAAQQTGQVGLKEYAYGITMGASEAALETIVGGIGKAASSLATKGATTLGKATVSRAARNGIGKKIISEATGEFMEEFLGDFVDVGAQKLYGINKDATVSFTEALRSGLVGMFSGAVMGGSVELGKAAVYTSSGSRIQANGNVDTLLKQANAVSDAFGTEGTNRGKNRKMNQFIASVQASTDAYNALSEEQKAGTRGALYLGEIQAAMAGVQINAGVQDSLDKIQRDAESYADYASKYFEKTVTADDIRSNKDNLAMTLAILRYTGEFMTPSETERMQQRVSEAIQKGRAEQAAAMDEAVSLGADPFAAQSETEKRSGESYHPINASESWNGESDIYQLPTGESLYIEPGEDGGYRVYEGTDSDFASGQARIYSMSEDEVRRVLEGARAYADESTSRRDQLRRESQEAGGQPTAETAAKADTVEASESAEGAGGEKTLSEDQSASAGGNVSEGETEARSRENGAKEGSGESGADTEKESGADSGAEKKRTLKDRIADRFGTKNRAEISEEDASARAELARRQDRARRAVRDYDTLPIEVRKSIDMMYESAEQSGTDARTADAAAALISVMDKMIVQFEQGLPSGNGYYLKMDEGWRAIVIDAKSDAQGGSAATLLHEAVHAVTETRGYGSLSELAMEQMDMAEQEEIEKRYREFDPDMSEDAIREEVTAEAVGRILSAGDYLDALENKAPIAKAIRRIRTVAKLLFGKNREAYRAARRLGIAFSRCIGENPQAAVKNTVRAGQEDGGEEEAAAKYRLAKENPEIYDLVQKVKSGEFKDNERVDFGAVNPDVADRISEITGIDVSDFTVVIEARQVKHILDRHGENGTADHSMGDIRDMAKLEYIASHPDNIVGAGKTSAYMQMVDGRNRPAKTVKLDKSIGDQTMYVVEAVPDTKAKKIYILTAYGQKKGAKKEVSHFSDELSPGATSETAGAITSTDSITQNSESVKGVEQKKFQLSEEQKAVNRARRQEEAARLEKERAAFIREYGVDSKEIDEFTAAKLKNAQSKVSSSKFKTDMLRLARDIGISMRYDGRQSGTNAAERAGELADQIAVELTKRVEIDEDLKAIKDHLKGQKLKIEEELKGDLPGGYNEFRKKNFGRLTLSSDGTAVDSVYSELTEIFGESWFPSDIANQADQLVRISEILANPVETLIQADDGTIGRTAMMLQKGLYDIMQKKIQSSAGYEMGKVAGFEEAVGRYGKQYSKVDAGKVMDRMREAVDRFANKYNLTVTMRQDYRPSYLKDRIYQMFNSATKYQIEDRAKVIADNYLHELTYSRGNVTRFAGELAGHEAFEALRVELAGLVKEQYKALGKETKYVKLRRESMAKISELQGKRRIDQRESNVIEHINRLLDLAEGKTKPSDHVDYDELNSMFDGLKSVKHNGRINIEKLRQWCKWFTDHVLFAREEEMTDTVSYLQENLSDAIKEDIRDIGNSTENELTEHMMNAVYDMIREFEHVYHTYGRIYWNGEWVETKTVSKDGVEQVRTGVHANERGGFIKRIFSAGLRFLLNAQDPIRVAEMLEGYSQKGVLSGLVRDMVISEAKTTGMYKDLLNPFDEFFEKHEKYQKRLAEEMIHSKFFGVDMSIGEAITLYMTSKREQAILGLANSDIQFSPDKTGKKRVTVAGNIRFEGMSPEEKINLLTGGIEEIYKQFNQTDKAFIALSEQFFNEKSSKIKREADKLYFGHEMPMESYYVPIARAESTIAKNITDATKMVRQFATVSNLSFNKKTVRNAQKSLLIRPVWDVITDHAQGLSKYANMYLPMQNFNRVWNTQTSEIKGHSESLSSVLESEVWGKLDGKLSGKGAEAYFTQLCNDMQNVGQSNRPGTSLTSILRSGAVTYGLGFNPKVWLTQNTSLIACMDTIDPRYYAYVFSNRNDELMDKYSLFARIRDYDTEVIRAQGLVDKVGKIGELTMKPISFFDRQVIRMLWGAAQAQVQGQKGYAIGSEENLKAAGELLDRAILRNQQTSGQGTRSGFMRGSEITKTLTMFSADSMKQMSSFVEAVGVYSRARSDAKAGVEGASARATAAGKQLVRSGMAIMGVAVAMAAITELFRALYKKDRRKDSEGEEIPVAGDMVIESFGNMVSILPIIREVYGLVTDGYDLSDFTLDAVSDTISAFTGAVGDVTRAAQGKYVSYESAMSDARDVIFAVGRTIGIPVNNMNNVMIGLLNVAPGNLDWSYQSLFSKPSYKSDLEKAIADGDDDLAALILKTWMKRESGGAGETAETLLDLYKNGYDVLSPTAPTSVTVNGESVTLTSKQRKQILTALETAQDKVADLVSSKEWNDLDDAAKAKSIRVLYDSAYSNAKADTVGTTPSKKAVLSMLYDPETVALISGYAGTVSVIKQDDEEIGKKVQIEEYLDGFTGDRSLLLYIAGYSSDEAKELLRKRIAEYTSDKTEQERLIGILGVAEEEED